MRQLGVASGQHTTNIYYNINRCPQLYTRSQPEIRGYNRTPQREHLVSLSTLVKGFRDESAVKREDEEFFRAKNLP